MNYKQMLVSIMIGFASSLMHGQIVQFFEDFSSSALPGWNLNGAWAGNGSCTGMSGYLWIDGNPGNYAETPWIPVADNRFTITYVYRRGDDANCGNTPESGERVGVDYSVDGVNWIRIVTYDGATAPSVPTRDSFDVSLPVGVKKIKIRFYLVWGTGPGLDNWVFDSLTIYVYPTGSRDVRADTVPGPVSACYSPSSISETFQFVYRNVGSNVIDTVFISVLINGSLYMHDTVISLMDTMDADTFTLTINGLSVGTNLIEWVATTPADANISNDTLRFWYEVESNPYYVPFVETFDHAPCWQLAGASLQPASACTGLNSSHLFIGGNPGNYARSPWIKTGGATAVSIGYFYRKGGTGCGETPDAGDIIRVQYSFDGFAWYTIHEYDGATSPSVSTWVQDTIVLPAGVDSFRIGFWVVNGAGQNADTWVFDSLVVDSVYFTNVSATDVATPSQACFASVPTTDTFKVVFTNRGSNLIDTVYITSFVNGALYSVDTMQVNIQSLQSDTFDLVLNNLARGVYRFTFVVTTDGDIRPWDDTIHFTYVVGTDPTPLPYYEGFVALPCWSLNGAWTLPDSACSGLNSEHLLVDGNPGNYAESPWVVTNGATGISIKYLLMKGQAGCGELPDAGDSIKVEYSYDGSTWFVVNGHDGATAPSTPTWIYDTIVLPVGVDSFKVRFRIATGAGSGLDTWIFDSLMLDTVHFVNISATALLANDWECVASTPIDTAFEVVFTNTGSENINVVYVYAFLDGALQSLDTVFVNLGSLEKDTFTVYLQGITRGVHEVVIVVSTDGDVHAWDDTIRHVYVVGTHVVQLPYYENFVGLPCWVLNGATVQGPGTCGGMGDHLRIDGSPGFFAETPWISSEGALGIRVMYRYRRGNAGCGELPDAGDSVAVEYSLDGFSWYRLKAYDGNNAPDLPTWDNVIFSLPQNVDSFKIRFYLVSGAGPGSDSWSFDSLRVEPLPCNVIVNALTILPDTFCIKDSITIMGSLTNSGFPVYASLQAIAPGYDTLNVGQIFVDTGQTTGFTKTLAIDFTDVVQSGGIHTVTWILTVSAICDQNGTDNISTHINYFNHVVIDTLLVPDTVIAGNTLSVSALISGRPDSIVWNMPGSSLPIAYGGGPHMVQWLTPGIYPLTVNAYCKANEVTRDKVIVVIESTFVEFAESQLPGSLKVIYHPAGQQLAIRLETPMAGKYVLMIRDVSGKTLYQGNLLPNGQWQYVDVSMLPAGILYVYVMNREGKVIAAGKVLKVD